MLVFRDGRSSVSGPAFHRAFSKAIAAAGEASHRPELTLDALLLGGELECALADANAPGAKPMADITDALAAALVRHTPIDAPWLLAGLKRIGVPATLNVSPPEGFAYYRLHPLAYADLVQEFTAHDYIAVIGIRSIGTTLGAVACAELRARGVECERLSVRPDGHPFNRCTRFTAEQLRWVARQQACAAEFLVVDEGPGLSGSSFLSVGDALLGAGVQRRRITFVCSHEPDVVSLRAPGAAARWDGFYSRPVRHDSHLPEEAAVDLSAGAWRARLLGERACWPASWIQMERAKYLSGDGQQLLKFEGFGRFGEQVRERALLLADGGFAPRPREHAEGFTVYPRIAGHPLDAGEVSTGVLDRIAKYCAFRAFEFGAEESEANQLAENDRAESDLGEMVRINLAEEFGSEPALDLAPLASETSVVPDGRMLPHEWLRAGTGQLFKTDGVSHGDDHFYPGATDIAWDLAGAIVEWELDASGSEYLLDRFQRLTGQNPRSRMPAFLLAYAAFRMAYSKMAATALRGCEEEHRLRRDYRRYRALAESCVPLPLAA